MKYIPKTMSLEDRAKMEYLEATTTEQAQAIDELKSNSELLKQCVLEMSEQVYQ